MNKIIIALFCCSFLVACHPGTVADKNNKPASSGGDSAGYVLRNHIAIKSSGGLQVNQAFLLRSNGSLVNDSNRISLGEVVELRILAAGWKGKAGKIALGGSEKITTSDGTVALDLADAFGNQPPIPVERAEIIRLQATVTRESKHYDYYQMDFKIWNKDIPGQFLTAGFRLHVENK